MGGHPNASQQMLGKQHAIQSPFQKLQATSSKFNIVVDDYTPNFVPVINPILSSLYLVQWRLTLDAMKIMSTLSGYCSIKFDHDFLYYHINVKYM